MHEATGILFLASIIGGATGTAVCVRNGEKGSWVQHAVGMVVLGVRGWGLMS